MSQGHSSHGNTPAAWTLVVFVTLGFIVGTVAIVMGQWIGVWIGVGLVVLGAIVGKVMQMMGLGQPRKTAAVHSG